ncbi:MULTISPECIES: hypothetical protein [unclassified Paenibacillus]|uniref:hypothetical protein n=1 Tax=unclassified Paenibacillus TaxID=185978 RepID=UPI003832820B
MVIISREQIVQSGITDARAAQHIIERTFIQKAAGNAAGAQEIAMIPDSLEAGAFYSLPAYLKEEGVAGIKWTSHVPKASGNQPYTHPLIILNDLQTGVPEALLEGELVSGLRTAAVSATAIKYLADPMATSLLICGSGFQANHQLKGVLPFLPHLKEVHIWSRNAAHADRMNRDVADLLQSLNITGRVHKELPGCLDFAQIIIGATSAATPYLHSDHFVNGHLYLHIGMRDIDSPAVAQFDEIICDDFRGGVMTSSQSLFRLAREDDGLERKVTLLEHILLKKAALRQNAGQKLMFNGFGLSIFDLALAQAVLKQLQAQEPSALPTFPLFKEIHHGGK